MSTYQTDKYGHLLSEEGDWLTDPYGHCTYGVGNGEDSIYFDYAVLEDGRVVLHSVVNSETGSFIQDFDYCVVPADEALSVAQGMLDQAADWNYDNDVKRPAIVGPSKKFLRDLKRALRAR